MDPIEKFPVHIINPRVWFLITESGRFGTKYCEDSDSRPRMIVVDEIVVIRNDLVNEA